MIEQIAITMRQMVLTSSTLGPSCIDEWRGDTVVGVAGEAERALAVLEGLDRPVRVADVDRDRQVAVLEEVDLAVAGRDGIVLRDGARPEEPLLEIPPDLEKVLDVEREWPVPQVVLDRPAIGLLDLDQLAVRVHAPDPVLQGAAPVPEREVHLLQPGPRVVRPVRTLGVGLDLPRDRALDRPAARRVLVGEALVVEDEDALGATDAHVELAADLELGERDALHEPPAPRALVLRAVVDPHLVAVTVRQELLAVLVVHEVVQAVGVLAADV